MADGDIALIPLMVRLASIIASILIGGFMLIQAQGNAVKRREWLIQSARDARTMKLLRHCFAFVCNALFIWLLQVSVVVLCATLMGFAAEELFDKTGFLLVAGIAGMPLVVITVLGKRADRLIFGPARR